MAVALATFAVSATAHATCSQGPLGYLIWPEADATDVPADTPIVVGRYFVDGDTSIIETTLRAADGTEIALEQTRLLPPPFVGCGAAETSFLRPGNKLTPGETYTIVNRAGPKSAPFEQKFTVGDRVAKPQATLSPDVIYLKVYSRPDCVQDGCAGISNMLVDLGEPPQQPVWLRLQDSANPSASNGWTFYPRGYGDVPAEARDNVFEIQLGVPVTAADSCIDVELLGVEGQTLFQERRCQPDRCAVGGLFVASSGGQPGGTVVDAATVPEGSCDDPPWLGDRGGIIPPHAHAGAEPGDAAPHADEHDDADGGTPSQSAAPSPSRKPVPAANGCNVSTAHALSRAGWLGWVLSLAALALARRRSRAPRQG